jgi:hypothetical protein
VIAPGTGRTNPDAVQFGLEFLDLFIQALEQSGVKSHFGLELLTLRQVGRVHPLEVCLQFGDCGEISCDGRLLLGDPRLLLQLPVLQNHKRSHGSGIGAADTLQVLDADGDVGNPRCGDRQHGDLGSRTRVGSSRRIHGRLPVRGDRLPGSRERDVRLTQF